MQRPLRILLVSNHRRFKIHFRAYPWARALAARGHQIDIMCHADTERWKTSYEELPGIRIIHNPDLLVGALRQGWDPVCAVRRAAMLFREEKEYDIIHCLDTRPAVVLPSLVYARARGIRIVSDWIDWWGRGGLISERRPLWYRILFGGFETFFEEHFRDKLDGLTAISSALVDRAVSLGVPRDRCLRISGGADLATFANPPARDEARRTLKLPTDAGVVCFSGLDVLIDLPLVVKAFAHMLTTRPDLHLLLVGPTDSFVANLAVPEQLRTRIVCTGPVPHNQLPNYLAAADVFLMPYADKVSNVGRWPNKVGDYMCIGRPTVSNPIGEVKSLFERFGIGVLADETPEAMADATLGLLNDPARAAQIGAVAQQVAAEFFSWPKLIEDLERFYYDILAKGPMHSRPVLGRTAAEA
jgi:glycosyltransferase involved in cell wall biosynthesis